MNRDRLDPIIQAICRCYDYDGYDTLIKTSELKERLNPINHSINNKHSVEAIYAILQVALNLIEELECTNATTVDENSKENQDLQIIASHVNQQKK